MGVNAECFQNFVPQIHLDRGFVSIVYKQEQVDFGVPMLI